jgi:diadenosine tetraphosphate (Ap4A) HIT family hydrolase
VTDAWRDDRVGSALRGEKPLVMARMQSGFADIGDTQHLPGYSLLLTHNPSVDHLTDLDWERRRQFLFDLSIIGEAVHRACEGNGLRLINYEVLGNAIPLLHGDVHARYDWEPRTRSQARSGAIRRSCATRPSSRTPTRSTASYGRQSPANSSG